MSADRELLSGSPNSVTTLHLVRERGRSLLTNEQKRKTWAAMLDQNGTYTPPSPFFLKLLSRSKHMKPNRQLR